MKRRLLAVSIVGVLWLIIFAMWQFHYEKSIVSNLSIEKVELIHDGLDQRINCSGDFELINLIKKLELIAQKTPKLTNQHQWYISINNDAFIIRSQQQIQYRNRNYRIKNLKVYELLMDQVNKRAVKK